MKLVHPDMQMQIILKEGIVHEWILESPALFSRFVGELVVQADGGEGRFVLSEDMEETKLSKVAEVIVNPFSVDINSRKMLSKLYGELEKTACGERMFLRTQEFAADVHTYFSELEAESDYMLRMDPDWNMQSFMKAVNVRFEDYAENFFEAVTQYLKTCAELLGIRLAVLVNARSYFDEEQIEQLGMLAQHNEFAVLLIENVQRDFSKNIRRYIIDKDRCEIY